MIEKEDELSDIEDANETVYTIEAIARRMEKERKARELAKEKK